ncbi:MAG: alpha/beta hydrolase fold domain-containing protein [Acidimicrobiales bacterium]
MSVPILGHMVFAVNHARVAGRPRHLWATPRRRTLLAAAGALLLVASLTACLPTPGPAPTLPAAGTCNSGPECCPPSSGSGVNYYGNLKYGHDVDLNQDLYLDAYLPQGAPGPVPGVVLVHGGAFVAGNKCSFGPEAVYLAQHGLAAFSIDYPLASSTQHPFVDVPQDTQLAVQWVRTYASNLGTNPNELALWGSSAGAAIAADAAYGAQNSDPPARVQALVGWSGAYDWITTYYRDGTTEPGEISAAEEYLGCSDFTDSTCFGNLLSSSPITHVSHGDPPTLMAASTDTGITGHCETVNPQNAVEMVSALGAHGVPITFQTTSACAHALAYANDPIDPPGTGSMLENTTAWLTQQLVTNPSPPTTPSPLPPPISGTVVTKTSACSPPKGSGVSYTPNVVYGQDFNNPLYLDVYLPQNTTGPTPGVVLVHGGGHVIGDKCQLGQEALGLAQNGIAVFAVNYPLATAQQPTFPNPVYDVMNAVAWVRTNAANYRVVPTELGLWGGSAGGNLALSAAFAAPLVQPSATVEAVASWSGTADTFELIGEYQKAGNYSLGSWADYIGCSDPWSEVWDPAANTCLTGFEQASPVQMIDPLGPPFGPTPAVLVATSTDFTGNGHCEIVPPRQAQEVQQRAQANGLVVQMDTNKKCKHAFAYFNVEFPSTLAFFQAHL